MGNMTFENGEREDREPGNHIIAGRGGVGCVRQEHLFLRGVLKGTHADDEWPLLIIWKGANSFFLSCFWIHSLSLHP